MMWDILIEYCTYYSMLFLSYCINVHFYNRIEDLEVISCTSSCWMKNHVDIVKKKKSFCMFIFWLCQVKETCGKVDDCIDMY